MTPPNLGGVFVYCSSRRLSALERRRSEREPDSSSVAKTDLQGRLDAAARPSLDVENGREIRPRLDAPRIWHADAPAHRESKGGLAKGVEHEAHDDVGSAGQRCVVVT